MKTSVGSEEKTQNAAEPVEGSAAAWRAGLANALGDDDHCLAPFRGVVAAIGAACV